MIDIAIPAYTRRKLYRSDQAVVAGVAAGLADHLRVDVRVLRTAFFALTLAGGMGILMYIAFWALVPQGTTRAASTDQHASSRSQRNRLLPLAALALGGLLLVDQAGLSLGGRSLWPVFLGAFGLALVWREADDAQRRRLTGLSIRGAGFAGRRPFGLMRIGGGLLLLLAGLASFVAVEADWRAAWNGLRAGAIVLAGVLLIFGPWWWRLVQELATERRQRIRSEERVEVATHVHDSVLHTLALIQRNAADPREVARLARGQERELRRWLYRPEGEAGGGTLHAALEAIAAETEDNHALTVEVVVVGDCPLDEKLQALVAAAREALVNAAKHAGVEQISLYAEVEADSVSVFVRDRGRGFDPDSVATDRYGLAESVMGRMRRAGGTATVRSSPGEGAEVQIHMQREG